MDGEVERYMDVLERPPETQTYPPKHVLKKKISWGSPQSDFLKIPVGRRSIKSALSSVACCRVVDLKGFFYQKLWQLHLLNLSRYRLVKFMAHLSQMEM